MTKERISSIDILKGIGIILVMLGHALPHDSFVRTLIYTFHMPLFFWCSGFFYKDKPLKGATIKDAKSLLIPWITFSLFLTLSACVLGYKDGQYSLLQFNVLNENSWCIFYTIWFLVCMFFVKVVYQGLATILRNQKISNLTIWGVFLLVPIEVLRHQYTTLLR